MPSFSSIATATGVAIFALIMIGTTTSTSEVENTIQTQQESTTESGATVAGYDEKGSAEKNEPVVKASKPMGTSFQNHWAWFNLRRYTLSYSYLLSMKVEFNSGSPNQEVTDVSYLAIFNNFLSRIMKQNKTLCRIVTSLELDLLKILRW
ncbi:hypothetical protein BDC45DRAFT_536537 [Circinella umbellata]|nr:hypothetical protein BDC45DRAFT_536537 [Circinella umbellata]